MATKSLEQKIDALTSIVEKGFAVGDKKFDDRFTRLEQLIERGFAAVADDVGDIREKMATKDQVLALQTQVNSIEQQLRDTKTEIRLGKLEEKVFGAPRR